MKSKMTEEKGLKSILPQWQLKRWKKCNDGLEKAKRKIRGLKKEEMEH